MNPPDNSLIVHPHSQSTGTTVALRTQDTTLRELLISPFVIFAPPNLIAFFTVTAFAEFTWLYALLNLVLFAVFHTALGFPDFGRLLNQSVVKRIAGSYNESAGAMSQRSRSKSGGRRVVATPKAVEALKQPRENDADSGIDLSSTTASVPPSPTSSSANDKLVTEFLELCDSTSIPWDPVVTSPDLEILRHPHHGYFYKLTAYFNIPYKPALYTVFDLLADIEARPEWDDLCAEARVLENVDASTRIQYFKSKGVMWTTPRDAVLLSHVRTIEPGKKLLCVTTSVTHDLMPERSDAVRMSAGIAGQMVEVEEEYEGGQKLRLVQLVNGDPKGNLPKMAIDFVATKGLPRSINALKKKVLALEPKVESTLLPPTIPTSGTLPVQALAVIPPKPVVISRSAPPPVRASNRSLTSTLFNAITQSVKKTYNLMRFAQPVMTTGLFVMVLVMLVRRRSLVRYLASEMKRI